MNTLPKSDRLCGRNVFDALFATGGKGVAGVVLVRSHPNGGTRSRIAAVAGRKLGNAVLRNRMRRRIRAAFRTARDGLPTGWDFAVVAKKGLVEVPWQDLIRDMTMAARRATAGCSGRRRSPPTR